jgi:sulfur relay (sulfurtransferase) DsrC/TusE family protein
MSINNREDANKYYQEINKLVDDYMESGKIRPSNLKNYLKPGSDRSKKFLARNNYKEVVGIDQVFSDVIEDRVNMERDGVLSFENFKFFESDEFKFSSLTQCLYKGVGKADRDMEKTLANVFKTDLGSLDSESEESVDGYLSSVEGKDSYKHLFKIDDWGKNIETVIYSKEDLDIIYLNIVEYLYDEFQKKEIEIVPGIKITLKSMIDKSGFEKGMHLYFEEDVYLNLVGSLLKMEFHKQVGQYYIWVKNI